MKPAAHASPAVPGPSPVSTPPAGSWRWWVLGTLFLATFLNYFDRQTLSVAIEPISREFGLGAIERGRLLAAFVYAYALAHLFIGFVIDRVRTLRLFFPAMVLGWSASTVLVGLASEYTHLLYLRYALGVFEAANFPICLLIIARIFPPHQRSLAAGIFNSGAVFATLAAPKLVIFFSTNYSWRYSFFVTGALGVLWLVPWLLIFRDERVPAPVPVERPSAAEPGTRLFGPGFWSVALIGVGLLPGWYFMSQWLPSYLTQAWNLPYDQALGNRLTLIYFTQDLGLWLGGGAVWWLTRRGVSVLRSRKTVIVVGYVLMMSILLLPRLESVGAVLAVLCVYVFGLAAWQANQQAFKQDISPARVATVAALIGFAETASSAFLVEKVGEVVQRTGGFNAIFLFLAACFTGSLVILLVLKKRWLQIQ
jgi:ACS family hexuronate transporter-like MFS transporter